MWTTPNLNKALCLLVLCLPAGFWAADGISEAAQFELRKFDFSIFWPPRDPSQALPQDIRPLLNGCLVARLQHAPNTNCVIYVRMVLTRPSNEAGREFWNEKLAFPEYDWMRYVRVWDTDRRWLWPNLAYLLRIHGIERVERYGGVDPAKGVDNDFAAILIRRFKLPGLQENSDTRQAPLVAAEWYPVGFPRAEKQTIVHTVQSDEFMLHLGGPQTPAEGLATIWLIYADFMGAKLPESWPKTPEYAGGILNCFEAQWDSNATRGQQLSLRQIVPKRGTGFSWERWGAELEH
jgi:hypothetical protein